MVNLPVAEGQITLGDDWTVPVRPLIGCLATAPARETVLSRHEGTTMWVMSTVARSPPGRSSFLPVAIDGALLYFGDCKAAMADGEVGPHRR